VQYSEGVVDVTYLSQTVVGHGTNFLANVQEGDWFKILHSDKYYQIGSVDSATQLSLTTPYEESTSTNESYLIVRDFTANYHLPIIEQGDRDWTFLLRRALETLDEGAFKKVKDTGLDADKPTYPVVGQVYVATDTNRLYICTSPGVWSYIALTEA